MPFKVTTQGVFTPLLDAINRTKLEGESNIEILYSFGSTLKQSRKDESNIFSSLSTLDFIKEVESAFNLWEFIFKSIYRKNSKNKSSLSISFKEVETGGDLIIESKDLKGNTPFTLYNGNIKINSSLDWVTVNTVKGVKVFNYLVYSIGRALGLPESVGDNVLNTKLLHTNYIVKFNLKLTPEGGILDFTPFYSKKLEEIIQSIYGGANTNLLAIYGCTDVSSTNYNSDATIDDGSCLPSKISTSRLLPVNSVYRYIAVSNVNEVDVIIGLIGNGYFSMTTLNPPLPLSINPEVSCIFRNESGDDILYTLLDTSGNIEIFNRLGNKVSNNPTKSTDSLGLSIDFDLIEGFSGVFKFKDYLAVKGITTQYSNSGVYTHTVDINANQIVDGNIVVDCDTNSPLGNYEDTAEAKLKFPGTFTENENSVGFSTYSEFLADKDLTSNALNVADFSGNLKSYSTSLRSTKLATFKAFSFIENGATDLESIDFLVYFDIYSSNFLAAHGSDASDGATYRINNGRPNGDGTYDYSYTLGPESFFPNNGVTSSDTIVSTFEGFSFDNEDYGIYSISGRQWNSSTSSFDLPSTQITVNPSNPSDHEYLISHLPVVIGDKLFEEIGGIIKAAKYIGSGGNYDVGGIGSLISAYNVGDNVEALAELERSIGYYIVAYAVKHGIILMRMYSQSPFLLRPDDGGIELHICGGDPNDSIVADAGGFTPISMAFSFYNNYLYTIVRNPDTMDKYICIYNLTSNDAGVISNDVKMIADPLSGGASKVVTVDNSVYILSKGGSEVIKIPNADTFHSVNMFSLNPGNFIIDLPTNLLPIDTENRVSKNDEITIDPEVYTTINNTELSSFINTPRGILSLSDPIGTANLNAGVGEWLASATASDIGGNLLFTAAVTDIYTVVIWDRDNNVLTEKTFADGYPVTYGSSSCLMILPGEANSYTVILMVSHTASFWYSREQYNVSTVTFEQGEDLSLTAPTTLNLGTATDFVSLSSMVAGLVPLTSNIIVPGVTLYSSLPFNESAMYLYIDATYSRMDFNVGGGSSTQTLIPMFNDYIQSDLQNIDINNSCFTTYTDASTVAIGLHSDEIFEILTVDMITSDIISTMSAEAISQFNSLAANRNYNIAQMEFSQDKNWLYVLLRDKELDVINNPSKILQINLQYTTILSEHITELEDFYYNENFIGQIVPNYFTSDASGNLDYINSDIKEKSHLSGMFKESNGIIYTLFVNDGTVPPTLGKILNQNNDSSEFVAKHAPASIRLSDTPMNLGLYSAFIDMSNENFIPIKGPDDPITFVIEGCTDPDACNYNPAANYSDGSCEYPIDPCSCEESFLYEHCGCTDEPEYNEIAGVYYEPCEYCNDTNAINYGLPSGIDAEPVINNDMCVYMVCASEYEISDSGNTPCNGLSVAELDALGQNWEHDSSMCYFAFEGCECDADTLVSTTDSDGNPTHCVECGDYATPGATPPTNPTEADSVCGCGEEPIIDGWCDCDTQTSAYCDCDGNPNPGFCNGCSGSVENEYCGCGEDLLEEYQSNIGESGICDCEGTQKILYYQDLEDDGLGDPNNSQYYCEGDQPDGWVINSADTNIECSFDDTFEGYHNYQTGQFISGDVDAAGECGGGAFIDGCGEISYNSSNTSGLNVHGCCGNLIQDCLTEECVPALEATQNTSDGCECGYLPSNDPNCSQCVPTDQVDTIWECNNCTNIPESACDCFGHIEDDCGVCDGNNSSCSGCMDPIAENYDATAIVEGPCSYLTLAEILLESITAEASSTLVDESNFQNPFAFVTPPPNQEIDFLPLSEGYEIVTIDGNDIYKDVQRVTTKCQVISETNTTLICSNPLHNAEVTYALSLQDLGFVNSAIVGPGYDNINVPPGSTSTFKVIYYFRLTEEFLNTIGTFTMSEVFGSLSNKIIRIDNYLDDSYIPLYNFNGIGNLEAGEVQTITNTGEGTPTSLPQYHIYSIEVAYNEASGSHHEFELDFADLIPTVLPCNGEAPTPICCESSGVQNPGAFTTNADGELVADNECEVCMSGYCIPEEATTIEVCCDPLATNTIQDYNGDIHICNTSLCNYSTPEMSGLRLKATIHTQYLDSLEDFKWVLYSRSGSIINQSTPIALAEASGGVIVKEIQLASYANCMWFLPIGFEYNDIWKHIHLEILNTDIVTSGGVESEVLHSLLYGASPTKGGSIKIDLGNSSCTLGCDEATLQTEYCEKYIREDFVEFTDIILHVQTAGGDNNAFTNTVIEVINVTTGDTLSYLEALSPSTEYSQTFRIISDTSIGVKVINPNNGTLVYKLVSEFGELITIKEV